MRTNRGGKWWRDRSGATAIEYGLLMAMLALVAVGGFSSLYNSVKFLYEDNAERVNKVIID